MQNEKCKMKVIYLLPAFFLLSCAQSHPPSPLAFKSYEHNPVLSPGKPGDWDELFLWNPQAVKDHDIIYLFYLGGNISGRMAIGYATSEDGIHFKKFSGNPVVAPDDKGFDVYSRWNFKK
jgi:hypothetical protein